ncbi:hypothetical protein ACWDLG_39485 [Nonomuraea sp. NPDC003727]
MDVSRSALGEGELEQGLFQAGARDLATVISGPRLIPNPADPPAADDGVEEVRQHLFPARRRQQITDAVHGSCAVLDADPVGVEQDVTGSSVDDRALDADAVQAGDLGVQDDRGTKFQVGAGPADDVAGRGGQGDAVGSG